MCQATYIFFLTLFYAQPIRQSEEHKQEIKVSVQRCLQRVALTDTHCAPYFFRYDNSAEIVDPADNSCCFHIYDLRCFFIEDFPADKKKRATPARFFSCINSPPLQIL